MMELTVLEGILKLTSEYGISSVIAFIFLFYFIRTNGNQVKLILEELAEIKQLSTKRILDKQQAVSVFRSMLSEHIHKKLQVAKNKLIINDIHNRRKPLESYLSSEFKKITQDEIAILDTFVTTGGCLGDILSEVLEQEEWEKFMNMVFTIFFGHGTVENKMEDLGAMMMTIVNNMIMKLESKIK